MTVKWLAFLAVHRLGAMVALTLLLFTTLWQRARMWVHSDAPEAWQEYLRWEKRQEAAMVFHRWMDQIEGMKGSHSTRVWPRARTPDDVETRP